MISADVGPTTDRVSERMVDGVLAAVVLVTLLTIAIVRDFEPSPIVSLVGAAGAVGVEAILDGYRDRVRAVWERPLVRYGATVGTLGAVGVAVAGGAIAVLWVAVGGLAGYLTVLGTATIVGSAES